MDDLQEDLVDCLAFNFLKETRGLDLTSAAKLKVRQRNEGEKFDYLKEV
jgi:uncharacterized ferritin-like protein (DUF455 family)